MLVLPWDIANSQTLKYGTIYIRLQTSMYLSTDDFFAIIIL